MNRLRRTLGLAAGLFSLAALAAGADGSWTRCAAPARLAPDPGGRTFYVSPTGTDVTSCAVNWTFKTFQAAVNCALGKDTIYVKGGVYGPQEIRSFYPSDWVLITNAPGESPILDGRGPSGTGPMVADWSGILHVVHASKVAIQGLEIRNTGVPDYYHGGVGVRTDDTTYLRLYFNTIHDTARHAVLFDGHQVELVGNALYNAVMRNQNNQMSKNCDGSAAKPCYWDGGVATQSLRNQWGHTFRGNLIHDSWGECLVVGPVDGATVEGNRLYNCLSVFLYVSNSQNVVLNRNWTYAPNDSFNRVDSPGDRATAVFLANEGPTYGWPLSNIRVTNNILEWVSTAVRYWRDDNRTGGVADTYGNLYVGFNDMNRTQHSPMKFDHPRDPVTAASKIGGNLVLNTASGGATWLYTADDPNFWSHWTQSGNYNYSTVTTTNPGINDTFGTYITAYDWRSDAQARWALSPNSQPEMPSSDYHCSSHGQNNWNSPGAVN